MRQLVPFVGNSVVIMSFVVGIFLAALSAGYWLGGMHEKNHLQILHRNLFIAASLVGVFFSYPAIDFAYSHLQSLNLHILASTSIYLSFALFPIVFLLGQTIPLMTNLLKKNTVSQITGTALAINTIGSVLGSALTSLVLFYYLGMGATLILDITILFIITFIIIGHKNKTAHLSFAICSMVLAIYLNIDQERQRFVKTTNYANYAVLLQNTSSYDLTMFEINRSSSSGIYQYKGKEFAFKYVEKIKKGMLELGVKNSTVLVLGAGGFTLSKNDRLNNDYTYVDIDPQIADIAQTHFLNSQINGRFIAEDARTYTQNNKIKYDAVVVDLFSNYYSIPWHLTTKEFMDNVANSAKEGGYVFINTIVKKGFSDKYSQGLHNTITATFPYCYVMPALEGGEMTNVIYMCRKNTKQLEVFVDEYSRVEHYNIAN
jgi:predicted membrane-bound spermidine synthase